MNAETKKDLYESALAMSDGSTSEIALENAYILLTKIANTTSDAQLRTILNLFFNRFEEDVQE